MESDPDTGWQMATGRWTVQHHHVPSVDVLSYTAPNEPWTYPVGAGAVLYLAYLVGGFTLLSWISAAATAGTVALLLRRGSSASAAIAIIAVPMIAQRTTGGSPIAAIPGDQTFHALWPVMRADGRPPHAAGADSGSLGCGCLAYGGPRETPLG